MGEDKCCIKKCVISIVVVAVAYFLLDMLVWHVILGGMVMENMNLWRPMDVAQSKMWVAYIGYILFAWVFTWIYYKGYECGKCPKMQGLKYGAMVGLLVWGAGNMLQYPFSNMTDNLYIGSALCGIVEYTILGFVTGFMCCMGQKCDDKSDKGGRCCS
ncbi:MAG: hypothetical protein COV45_08040 [Deltaproteobacteria bacterium CG11_big_fil_rev_8_21_14_0_20_47_16]|nr:MAG: hypothetical protein COV45_08040 [Deltaproteobacteria bacterium CG11_big_fil_rev_8_21_14_0_20_47_16]